jgi:hypothetical protein
LYRNLVAESLNCIPKKKRLLPTAVPTLVNTPTTVREPKKEKNTGKHCIIGDKKKKRHRYTPNEQMLQLFNLQPISKTYICIKLYQLTGMKKKTLFTLSLLISAIKCLT